MAMYSALATHVADPPLRVNLHPIHSPPRSTSHSRSPRPSPSEASIHRWPTTTQQTDSINHIQFQSLPIGHFTLRAERRG